MRSKRVKNYWLKQKESFTSGNQASARAKTLRLNDQVVHVIIEKKEDVYLVKYSVAKWYYEQIQELGISL